MTSVEPPLDNWDPLSVEHAAEVFADAPFRWWICGGIALELFVGHGWRPHDDLDIGVLRIEASEAHRWLSSDWELWIASRGRLVPWLGAPLSHERQENNVWVRQGPNAAWKFDLTVGSGDDTEWYRRDATTGRPWDTTIRWTTDGIPYLTPEIQLLFKSKNPRSKDDLDAEKVIAGKPHDFNVQSGFLPDFSNNCGVRQLAYLDSAAGKIPQIQVTTVRYQNPVVAVEDDCEGSQCVAAIL